MDKSVPQGAAIALNFIAQIESRGRYDVIFGNHEDDIPHPIIGMTIDELLIAQRSWGKRWGSSAAGRYQIMPTTLAGLKATLKLTGRERFSPELQDRLAFQLLKQRGYAAFKAKKLTVAQFGKKLGCEWASMPMLEATAGANRRVARGETYYAGDRLNRALTPPEKVEAMLAKVLAAAS